MTRAFCMRSPKARVSESELRIEKGVTLETLHPKTLNLKTLNRKTLLH